MQMLVINPRFAHLFGGTAPCFIKAIYHSGSRINGMQAERGGCSVSTETCRENTSNLCKSVETEAPREDGSSTITNLLQSMHIRRRTWVIRRGIKCGMWFTWGNRGRTASNRAHLEPPSTGFTLLWATSASSCTAATSTALPARRFLSASVSRRNTSWRNMEEL